MFATIKSGEAAARRDLRYRLVAERLSQQSQESTFVNDAMRWGIEHEGEAIAAYESLTGNLVVPVGFIALADVMAGCSPDGIIGDCDGLVSIKCPKTATQIRYLRESRVPPDYLPQILCELWVTGAQWVDFFSFDPRLPDPLRAFLVHYKRDETAVRDFEAKALRFLEEVDREHQSLLGWGAMKEAV
jgi:hypothetical protein